MSAVVLDAAVAAASALSGSVGSVVRVSLSHGAFAGLVPAATDPAPSPSPTTIEIPPADQTSPGLLGFLVTFAVAIALIFLVRSFVRHLRVVESRSREQEGEDPGRSAPDTGDERTGGRDVPGESGELGESQAPGRLAGLDDDRPAAP